MFPPLLLDPFGDVAQPEKLAGPIQRVQHVHLRQSAPPVLGCAFDARDELTRVRMVLDNGVIAWSRLASTNGSR